MAVFTAGIVWDPREPLPPEFQPEPPEKPEPPRKSVMKIVKSSFSKSTTGASSSSPPIDGSSLSIRLKKLPDGAVEELTKATLPPLSVSIEGRIIHDTASVTVSQVFWNNADIPIRHASYAFPLPAGCSVTAFSCRVGRDKILKAKIQPKKDAKEAYQKAVTKGHTAALLEHNTSEIFTASLGNIPPDTRLETKITYITLLKRQFSRDRNIATFSIPTAIASRYGNPPADLVALGLQETPRKLAIKLEVMESEEHLEIRSESHEILVNRGIHRSEVSSWQRLSDNSHRSGPEVAVVELDPAIDALHQDFILTIESSFSNRVARPHAWLESHPFLENQKAMMITIPSTFTIEQGKPSERGEVLFLVDRSGSMEDKIGAVKSSLMFFLKGIPLGRTFNIWSFGSGYQRLWERSQAYNAESLQTALNYVEAQLRADMGGTELLPALDAMLKDRDLSGLCDVIILTDGQVWRLDETLALVQRTRSLSQGAVRFFSLGIGTHVSHALVQGIASRGGGYSEVISNASGGGWEDRVVAMLRAALTSHVNALNVKLNGENYDRFLTSPTNIATFNPFQGDRLFLLSKPDSPLGQLNDVTIEALKSDGEQISIAVEITRLQSEEATLHSLAARAILDDMEHSPSYSPVSSSEYAFIPGRAQLDQAQATDLACRFSLVSKWTSFFLQQENIEAEQRNEPTHAAIIVRDASDDLDLLGPRGVKRHRPGQIGAMRIQSRFKSAGGANTQDAQAGQGPIKSYDSFVEMGSPNDYSNDSMLENLGQHMSTTSPGHSPDDHMCDILPAQQSLTFDASIPARRRARKVARKGFNLPTWNLSVKDSLHSASKTIQSVTRLNSNSYTSERTLVSGLDSADGLDGGLSYTKQADRDRNATSAQIQARPMYRCSSSAFTTKRKRTAGSSLQTCHSDPRRELVRNLLSYQNFDGSISIDVQALLEPSLARAAQELEGYIVKQSGASRAPAATLAYTIIVVISLERDLQGFKDLWDLMIAKAIGYVGTQVSDESKKSGLMEFAKTLLTGNLFVALRPGTGQVKEAAEPPEGVDGGSEPTLVHVAPRD